MTLWDWLTYRLVQPDPALRRPATASSAWGRRRRRAAQRRGCRRHVRLPTAREVHPNADVSLQNTDTSASFVAWETLFQAGGATGSHSPRWPQAPRAHIDRRSGFDHHSSDDALLLPAEDKPPGRHVDPHAERLSCVAGQPYDQRDAPFLSWPAWLCDGRIPHLQESIAHRVARHRRQPAPSRSSEPTGLRVAVSARSSLRQTSWATRPSRPPHTPSRNSPGRTREH